MRGREVQLVAHLAHEADAQEQARHAGHLGALPVEVREALGRAVELGERGEDLARARTGEIDGREPLRDVGEVHAQAPVGQPPGEPLVHGARAARGGGHVEAVVVEPADRAVVHDPAGVAGHHAVADAAGLQVREAVGVEPVEELAGVRPAHDQLAERGHVDQAGGLVHRQRLGARVAVVVGAPPVARPQDVRAQLAVTGVHRRALGGLEGASGQRAHRHRVPGRPGGGGAHLGQALPGLLGHQPHRGQLAHAALAGPHRRGGVALGELDRVVALLHAQVDVLRGHVLAQAGEALAAPRARDRRRHGHVGRARRSSSRLLALLVRARARGLVAEAERVGGLARPPRRPSARRRRAAPAPTTSPAACSPSGSSRSVKQPSRSS